MQTNGAPGADRVAAAVAWLTAAGMAVFSVLEQALPDTACWMCYAAAILFLVPLTLHSMKFAAVAFQNIERRTYVSYGHAPLSFAIAVVAVAYLPFRATGLRKDLEVVPSLHPQRVAKHIHRAAGCIHLYARAANLR